VLSSVNITTCPQLAKAAMRAADEGAGFDPFRKSARTKHISCDRPLRLFRRTSNLMAAHIANWGCSALEICSAIASMCNQRP
jgi:hypothetical protein